MADYGATGCERGVEHYINAMVKMERLRDKVAEQHEEAPGRLRDLFEFLPGEMAAILNLPEADLSGIQDAAREGVRIIDQARDEMMRRKTRKVAIYLPGYRPDLEKVITRVEQGLFRDALAAASACLCTQGPPAEPYPQPTKVAESL